MAPAKSSDTSSDPSFGHRHVDRAAKILAGLLDQPALGERHRFLGAAILVEGGEHHPRTHRRGAVPGAVLGGEDPAAVLLRERLAGVEGHAEIGGMRLLLELRIDDVGRHLLVLVLGRAHGATAVPREAEVLAGAGDAVEFAGRCVVAHAVDLVVGEPELAVGRVEVHADRVADAARVDLAVAAVTVHADDAADAVLRCRGRASPWAAR